MSALIPRDDDPLFPIESEFMQEAVALQPSFFFRPTLTGRAIEDLTPGPWSAYLAALSDPTGRPLRVALDGDRLTEAQLDDLRKVDAIVGFASGLPARWSSHREFKLYKQETAWPGRLVPSSATSGQVYALVGDLVQPAWPRLGFDLHTYDNARSARAALLCARASYPGEMHFALVDNGGAESHRELLRQTASDLAHFVDLVRLDVNLGGSAGANAGLAALVAQGFEHYGVMSDDVLCTGDAIGEMTSALLQLDAAGYQPGVVGVVSNYVNGQQQVEIGVPGTWADVSRTASARFARQHDAVRQVRQLRPLCQVMHRDLVATVGGYDPLFGFGTFDDDDHNVRSHLAGFSLWIAEAAFAYHFGSVSFKRCIRDYSASQKRNLDVLLRKWQVRSFAEFWALERAPTGLSLYVAPGSRRLSHETFEIAIDGESVDLVHQATDAEFAQWLLNRLANRPRSERLTVIHALEDRERAAA